MRDGRGSGLRRRAAVTAAAVGEAPIPTTLGVRSIGSPSPVPGADGRVRLGTLTHQTAFLTGGARPLDLQVVDFGAG